MLKIYFLIHAQILHQIMRKISSQKMLITLLAIATELHLLFSNKSSICIDYEDLHRVLNRIYCENDKQPTVQQQ